MKLHLMTTSLLALSAMALTACGGGETAQDAGAPADAAPAAVEAAAPAPEAAVEEEMTQADKDWAALTKSPEDIAWQPGTDTLTHFLRDVQETRLRLREEGLKFWQAYPDDPRRYSWLIMTVAMPPAYAADIDEWIAEETRIGANKAAVDESALAAWEAIYPEMRETFWAAEEVNDQRRRLLWSTELQQKVWRLREARARGEEIGEPGPLLAEMVELIKAFPAPLEGDRGDNPTQWMIVSTAGFLLGRSDIYNVDEEMVRAFGTELAAIEAEVPQKYAKAIEENGHFYGRWRGTAEVVDAHFAEKGLESWDDWYAQEEPGEVLNALFYDVYSFPAYNQPSVPEGRAVLASDRLMGDRRFVEVGMRLWPHMSRGERRVWYNWTTSQMPSYEKGYMDHMINLASREYDKTPIDKPMRDDIDARLAALSAEYLSHPETTDADRSFVREQEVWVDIMRVMRPADKGEENVQRILDDIRDLHVNYKSPKAVAYATRMRKYTERVGATGPQMRAFFEEFLEDENEDMRNIAMVALDPTAFDNKPFVFEAPTMDGEMFNVEQLRGKIVLVDHWDTGCSACIAAFPTIHETYLKYKDRGFEVLSIAYDGGRREQRVRRIKDELGLTWTTLNGEGKWDSVAARYLYTGYPQYMLLDRQGRMIASSEELRPISGLDARLDAMLAAEEAATAGEETQEEG